MKKLTRLLRALMPPARRGGRQSRGFTLVELVISVGITAAIGGLVASTSLQVLKEDLNGAARLHIAKEVTRIPRWMVRDVHRATTSDVVDSAPAVQSASFDWTDETGSHSCVYALSGTDLVRTCDSSPVTVGTEISGLQFTRSGDLLTVIYTVEGPGRPDMSQDVNMNMFLGGGK